MLIELSDSEPTIDLQHLTYTIELTDGAVMMESRAESIPFAVSDESTALTVGSNKIRFAMPFDQFALADIMASVNTAPTGATLIIDVKKNGVSVFTTTLSIDAGETSSITALVPAVLKAAPNSVFVKGDIVGIDILQIGSTIAGAGLKVSLNGFR